MVRGESGGRRMRHGGGGDQAGEAAFFPEEFQERCQVVALRVDVDRAVVHAFPSTP